ncbi:hypothetical protein HanRHA438_Chr03g0141581 [Helianthus annuus]|nr:hypothetical protein HanRHA438_Chr03g0141581 [Helianthus annuus]
MKGPTQKIHCKFYKMHINPFTTFILNVQLFIQNVIFISTYVVVPSVILVVDDCSS